MRIFHILRAHPRMSLVATLAFALVLIIFWSQLPTAPVLSHDVPPYPDAQNLSHETPLFNGGWVHDCGHNGEGRAAHTRITRFVTTDSREDVLRFYTAALLEHGDYQVTAREGRQVWFQDQALIMSQAPANQDPNGYGMHIEAMAVSGGTAVWITEYEYELSPRSCHL
jgi:hypothetical protein